jgi:hypothetical protein
MFTLVVAKLVIRILARYTENNHLEIIYLIKEVEGETMDDNVDAVGRRFNVTVDNMFHQKFCYFRDYTPLYPIYFDMNRTRRMTIKLNHKSYLSSNIPLLLK